MKQLRYRLRCWRQLGTLAATAYSDDVEKLRSKAHNYPQWEIAEYAAGRWRMKDESRLDARRL